jgi:rSAM/selenodomain-associated transferase 2
MSRLSVIIPARNEQAGIGATLERLQGLRRRGHQVLVVDGGSHDNTVARCAGLADTVIAGRAGRAVQMNAGAALADGDILLFLHADTRVPANIDKQIIAALAEHSGWGHFDVRLSGRHPLLRLVESLMNLRARLSGIATGDQGLFVSRCLFDTLGGFPDIPLMEDIAFSRQLKRVRRPHCLRTRLVTSSRRWERQGVLATIFKMWVLRLAYSLGVPAAQLARHYD